jgi:hypothetical protein
MEIYSCTGRHSPTLKWRSAADSFRTAVITQAGASRGISRHLTVRNVSICMASSGSCSLKSAEQRVATVLCSLEA